MASANCCCRRKASPRMLASNASRGQICMARPTAVSPSLVRSVWHRIMPSRCSVSPSSGSEASKSRQARFGFVERLGSKTIDGNLEARVGSRHAPGHNNLTPALRLPATLRDTRSVHEVAKISAPAYQHKPDARARVSRVRHHRRRVGLTCARSMREREILHGLQMSPARLRAGLVFPKSFEAIIGPYIQSTCAIYRRRARACFHRV